MSSDIQANVDAKLSDEACENIWKVYLREAEEYDQGLVKSWKEDMDVTLVFSGLYSTVLTAFIIESYKNLQPDQSELSTNILLHISGQLAGPAGPFTSAASGNQFKAKASDIACNIMWFLSLILALICALLATFVQQWTRHFLHRSTILRAPAARARFLAFLYFGLKRFKMHTIVDLIPLLLHVSLFSFFGGLVAFLIPINLEIQWMTVGLLTVIALAYIAFTAMPLIALSSPYQTPISPLLWRTWKSIRWSLEAGFRSVPIISLFGKQQNQPEALPISISTSGRRQYNLTYAMVEASKLDREERDAMSLAWTMRSLNNNTELLTFIEALPSVIFGSGGTLRLQNIPLIRPLLETKNPEGDIIARTLSLLSNCREIWELDPDVRRIRDARYRSAFSRCLWSLFYVLNRKPNAFQIDNTGRTSWFTTEQRATLERHRSFIGEPWSIPIFSLIKYNAILHWESSVQRHSFSNCVDEIMYLNDSAGCAQVVIEYLTDATGCLPLQTGLITSTFYALAGPGAIRIQDDRLVELLGLLLSKLKVSPIGFWDPVFFCVAQVCTEEYVPLLCEILLERKARHPINTWNVWYPGCDRQDNHLPGYRAFLQAVIACRNYNMTCIHALRSILWSFGADDYSPVQDCADVAWWTHSEILWLEVLPQLEKVDSTQPSQMDPFHTSLAVMIKCMFLKKQPPLRSTAGDPINFEMIDFISNNIMDTIPTTLGLPAARRIAFVALVVTELGAIVETDPATFTEIEDTLKYLECKKLKGAGYDVDPELAKKLAEKTLASTLLWRAHTMSLPLLDILTHIWTLWDVNNLSPTTTSNGGNPNPASLLPEVNAYMRRAIHVFTGLATSRSEVSDKKNEKHIAHSQESPGSSSVAFCFCSPCEDKIKSLLARVRRIEQHWGYTDYNEEDSNEVDSQIDSDPGNDLEGEERSEIENSSESHVDDSKRAENIGEPGGGAGDEKPVGRPSDGNWDSRNGWHEDGGTEWK